MPYAGAEAGLETAAFYEHALEDDLTELLPFFLLTELLPFTSLLGSIRCQQCHHRLRNRLGLGQRPRWAYVRGWTPQSQSMLP